MTTKTDSDAKNPAELSGAHRRTLEAIFRHPMPHNLEWRDAVNLITEIGTVHEQADGKFAFEIAGQRRLLHKPHTKDLTSSEVAELRHVLAHAGWSPDHSSQAPAHPTPPAPTLLIVTDHYGTRIFDVNVSAADAAAHVIKPYDPHHFLHHLVHKDQSRERGQRAPEEPAYYKQIADAVALGGRLVVVGHGTGKSNAAHHLTEYLRAHHPETYQRIVREISTDLSSITDPQLLALVHQALR